MENICEIIKCDHGEICYIKTGLKNPATYLKSFYLCASGKCKFNKKAEGLEPMKCLIHPESYVELRKPFYDNLSNKIGISYRCQMHCKTKKWCGSTTQLITHTNDLLENKNCSNEKSLENKTVLADLSFRESAQTKEICSDDDVDCEVHTSKSKDEELIHDGKNMENNKSSESIDCDDKPIMTLKMSTNHIDTSEFDVYIKRYCGSDLEIELSAQKNLLTSINLKKLPDGGDKIRSTVEKMTKALEYLKLTNKDNTDTKKEQNVNIETSTSESLNLKGLEHVKYTDPLPMKKQTSSGNYCPSSALGTLKSIERNSSLETKGSISNAIESLHTQLESCPSSTSEEDVPTGLKVDLMLHQRQALAWLMWRELQTPRGGILADDMGLGKTLTMISLILKQKDMTNTETPQPEWLQKAKSSISTKSTLVVCPASLIHQWEGEIEKRVKPGLLKVFIYHGPSRKDNFNKLLKADVVLTTYNIISSEVGVGNKKRSSDEPCNDKAESEALEQSSSPLLRILWQRIILDEGHTIKNRKSVTAMSSCRLRADVRWILSGTPIHNDLSDIYSLLRFLRCSPFDDFIFWKRQADNKSQYGQSRINMIIKVLMLRRTKDQKCSVSGNSLVSLPQKEYKVHDICLSKEERKIYDNIFAKSKAKMLEYLNEQELKERNKELGSKGMLQGSSEKTHEKVNSATQMLLLLLRLRQSCCHPYLMKEAAEVEDLKTDELEIDLVDQMNALSMGETVQDVEQSLTSLFEKETFSTKVKQLVEIMENVRRDSETTGMMVKSVIVSQWTKMLDIVEHHLNKVNFSCCVIKGDIPAKKRSEIVDAFNLDQQGPEVMLLSLRAGGTGLNLIGGSHLYIIDMHWNPALEQQACDRIYRVGQKKDVFIHKFVCKETIEEKIVQLQQRKMNLASNVLTGVGGTSTKLSLKDLRVLFGLESRHLF